MKGVLATLLGLAAFAAFGWFLVFIDHHKAFFDSYIGVPLFCLMIIAIVVYLAYQLGKPFIVIAELILSNFKVWRSRR